MKIFTKDSVYVQISDINYLINELSILLPPTIPQTVYGTSDGLRIIDKTNEDEFVRFTDEEAIKFFKDDSIILDYDEVKDLDELRIKSLLDEVLLRSTNILLDSTLLLFKDTSEDDLEEIEKKGSSYNLEADKLVYRQKALYAYLNYLKGKSKMVLPDEVLNENKQLKKSNMILKLLQGKKKDKKNKGKQS